jgi:sulfur-oxidizing protein SoxX
MGTDRKRSRRRSVPPARLSILLSILFPALLSALLTALMLPCALAQTGGAALSLTSPASLPATLASYRVVGDAIAEPLTTSAGDAVRGRAIVANRQLGLCLLCHTGPIPEERFQGNLAPDLGGAGSRWSAGQLRLRMVDASRLNPSTIMPSYYRIDGLTRVSPAWQGQPILTAQQVEDVVAFLLALRQ